jgi:hypothetical protein
MKILCLRTHRHREELMDSHSNTAEQPIAQCVACGTPTAGKYYRYYYGKLLKEVGGETPPPILVARHIRDAR